MELHDAILTAMFDSSQVARSSSAAYRKLFGEGIDVMVKRNIKAPQGNDGAFLLSRSGRER